MIKMLNW